MAVTQLSYDEYKAVSDVLPVMLKIGVEILNKRVKGDYFKQDLRNMGSDPVQRKQILDFPH